MLAQTESARIFMNFRLEVPWRRKRVITSNCHCLFDWRNNISNSILCQLRRKRTDVHVYHRARRASLILSLWTLYADVEAIDSNIFVIHACPFTYIFFYKSLLQPHGYIKSVYTGCFIFVQTMPACSMIENEKTMPHKLRGTREMRRWCCVGEYLVKKYITTFLYNIYNIYYISYVYTYNIYFLYILL